MEVSSALLICYKKLLMKILKLSAITAQITEFKWERIQQRQHLRVPTFL